MGNKEMHMVVIDRDGHVKCGSTTVRGLPICYKWRSPLACKGCPMTKLILRSKENRNLLMFEKATEEKPENLD